jgi:hypothetical protein
VEYNLTIPYVSHAQRQFPSRSPDINLERSSNHHFNMKLQHFLFSSVILLSGIASSLAMPVADPSLVDPQMVKDLKAQMTQLKGAEKVTHDLELLEQNLEKMDHDLEEVEKGVDQGSAKSVVPAKKAANNNADIDTSLPKKAQGWAKKVHSTHEAMLDKNPELLLTSDHVHP